jgi:hypothetical protein
MERLPIMNQARRISAMFWVTAYNLVQTAIWTPVRQTRFGVGPRNGFHIKNGVSHQNQKLPQGLFTFDLRVLIWNFLPKEERKSALIKIDQRLKSTKLLQHVCDFI